MTITTRDRWGNKQQQLLPCKDPTCSCGKAKSSAVAPTPPLLTCALVSRRWLRLSALLPRAITVRGAGEGVTHLPGKYLGQLTCLQELILRDCLALRQLPASLALLPSLQRIRVEGCYSVMLDAWTVKPRDESAAVPSKREGGKKREEGGGRRDDMEREHGGDVVDVVGSGGARDGEDVEASYDGQQQLPLPPQWRRRQRRQRKKLHHSQEKARQQQQQQQQASQVVRQSNLQSNQGGVAALTAAAQPRQPLFFSKLQHLELADVSALHHLPRGILQHHSLKHLVLDGYSGASLSAACSINSKSTESTKSMLESPIHMPSLRHLELRNLPKLSQLPECLSLSAACPSLTILSIQGCPRFSSLPTPPPSLHTLKLCNLPNLTSICHPLHTHCPLLSVLVIDQCASLHTVPTFLRCTSYRPPSPASPPCTVWSSPAAMGSTHSLIACQSPLAARSCPRDEPQPHRPERFPVAAALDDFGSDVFRLHELERLEVSAGNLAKFSIREIRVLEELVKGSGEGGRRDAEEGEGSDGSDVKCCEGGRRMAASEKHGSKHFLPCLQRLSLANCEVGPRFPPWVRHLTSLQHLSLTHIHRHRLGGQDVLGASLSQRPPYSTASTYSRLHCGRQGETASSEGREGETVESEGRIDPSSSSVSSGVAAVGSGGGGGGEEGRRGFFVEVWDVSGSEQYKSSRSLFYDQINGVIFVHDLSRKKSRVAALQWMDELVRSGTFSAPSHGHREGQLPVPLLVIGNKDDLRDKDPVLQGRVKLLRAARSSRTLEYAMKHAKTVVERYGLRSFGRRKRGELPEYIRNPRGAGLIACAKQGRLDLAAVDAFFLQLIKRRYFTEQLTALPSPSRSWSQPFLYVEGMEGMEGELNADALLLPSSSARTGGEQQGSRGRGEGAVAGLYCFNSLRGYNTRWVGLLRC
ncbi:unnamed protein product [Closterium sp. Naga37s-1]|nr:unnamed protein product [Closterium sp. Naga37s-1]